MTDWNTKVRARVSDAVESRRTLTVHEPHCRQQRVEMQRMRDTLASRTVLNELRAWGRAIRSGWHKVKASDMV